MKGEGLPLRWALLLSVAFIATRVVLHLSGEPYFDPDSYKYLGAADSLRAGTGLPPLYDEVPVNGGALHAVPGYGYFIYALWQLTGVTIDGITIVQSVVSLLGFLALAHLLSLWVGRGAAIATVLVLTLSPSVAWLEHTIMPDGMAAPLLLITFWLATIGDTTTFGRLKRGRSAILAGLITGFQIFMRTSSQAYAPLPWMLAVHWRAGFRRKIGWLVVFAAGVALALYPWVARNHEKHGIWVASASIGRNFYFNAVYSGAIPIGPELTKYKMKHRPVPHSAYALSDKALQAQIAKGLTLPQADRKLGEYTWEAYKNGDWETLAKQRLALVLHLFLPSQEEGTGTLTPLRDNHAWYLANVSATTQVRKMLETRFRYKFSDEYVQVASRRAAPSEWARKTWELWVKFLTVDGIVLLVAFGVAVFAILLRSNARKNLIITLVAPPVLFLVTFAFFQAPLYRYQAGLHVFMLATVVAACASSSRGAVTRALPHGIKLRRRMAGYAQDFWK